jgi:hypothetical protein
MKFISLSDIENRYSEFSNVRPDHWPDSDEFLPDNGHYGCPNCDEYTEEDSGNIYYVPGSRGTYWTDYGTGNSWREEVECSSCGTYFAYENGDL